MPQLLNELNSEGVIACIAFISQEALEDEYFNNLVTICNDLFLKRQEFRLVVQLVDGLTFDILKDSAIRNKESAAGQLIDSVHLSSQVRSDIPATIQMLRNHLKNLPKIRHRLTRERWESRWIKILTFFTVILLLLFSITTGMFLLSGSVIKNTAWIPWMFFGAGQLFLYQSIEFSYYRHPNYIRIITSMDDCVFIFLSDKLFFSYITLLAHILAILSNRGH